MELTKVYSKLPLVKNNETNTIKQQYKDVIVNKKDNNEMQIRIVEWYM